MRKNFTKYFARAGVVAALYVTLSLLVMPVASGAVQIRISEGLALLPLVFVEAIPALFVGCLLVNIITGCAVVDVFVGSAVTLVAAIFTCFVGRKIKNFPLKIFIGGLFPVLLNAFILPLIWRFYSGNIEYVYIIQVLFLFVGQTVSVYAVGTPLVCAVKKFNEKID